MAENYDAVDSPELLQEVEPEIPVVKVSVEGIVRTDEMPAEVTYFNSILGAGSPAVKLMQADPRRKRVVCWLAGEIDTTASALFAGVCLGATMGQAQAFSGTILPLSSVHVRTDIAARHEIWVRPVAVIGATGKISFLPTNGDVLITGFVEKWSR